MRGIFILVPALLAGSVLFGQTEPDYQSLMKTISLANQSFQKNLTAQDAAGIITDAQKLQDTFKEVEDFWQKRNSSDAVDFAKRAQAIAASVSKSALAGHMDQAMADAKLLGATCGGCHMAHREKTETGFKIK